MDIHANEAVHEIQFGHLRRPNHYSRQYDADRFEVSNHKWSALVEEGRGFAVLNDCKYGLNVLGNSINLTLLRSPKAPDMNADQGVAGVHVFLLRLERLAGGERRGARGVRPELSRSSPRPATAASGRFSRWMRANVIVECVKPAEDGSRDIIVRLYESKRTAVRCALQTSLPVEIRTWQPTCWKTTSGRCRSAPAGLRWSSARSRSKPSG